MAPLDPTRALRYALWGLVLIGGLVALRVGRPPAPSDDPARDILAADLARRMHANALALDSARVALRSATIHVTRDVFRYREFRDTLNLTDTVQVKVFVQRADSVVRSCTALVESCDRFRVRADSSLASLSTDRDFWKARYEHSKPSRWEPVKQWGIRIAIGYGAFKLGQSVR